MPGKASLNRKGCSAHSCRYECVKRHSTSVTFNPTAQHFLVRHHLTSADIDTYFSAGSKRRKVDHRSDAFDVQAFLDSAGIAKKIVDFRRGETIFTQGDTCKHVL